LLDGIFREKQSSRNDAFIASLLASYFLLLGLPPFTGPFALVLLCFAGSRALGKPENAQELLARYHPRPKPREVIKPLAAAKTLVPQVKRQKSAVVASLFEAAASPEKPQESLFTSAREGKREDRENKEEAQPLAVEQRYEIRFSINSELKQKLDKARILLSGKYPRGAALEDVLGEALELLLEKKSPEQRSKRREARKAKKLGHEQAKQSEPAKPSRHIPQELRDEVYQRDGGCCAFVGTNGRRCAERFDLEVHHLQPRAKGGEHSLSNLELRCKCHNLYDAELDYGQNFMQRFTAPALLSRGKAESQL